MTEQKFEALLRKHQQQNATKITKETIVHAMKVVGIEFSDGKCEQLVEDLNRHLERYERFRGLRMNNSAPLALRFSPIMPGMKFEMSRKPIRLSRPPFVRLPSDREELAFWPLMSLAQLIKTRQVASVELTEMYLARLKRYDPMLQFVTTLTEDLAMRQARQADAEIAAGRYRGPLHGIPWGCKDTIAKSGYNTTWGAAGVRPVNWRVISLGLVQADQRVSCSQERLQTHSAERSR